MDAGVSLRDSQVPDLAFMIREPRCALLHDPGVGKTPPVVVYTYWLWSAQQQRTLWVMPKQLCGKNKKEILRFTHFTDNDVMILDKKPDPNMVRLLNPKVIIMGPDRFKLSWQELTSLLPDIGCVVGDETHMYWATSASARTQSLYMAMQKIPRFVAMTGSIIKGRLNSAYPIIHVIEPRYYPSYEAFMDFHSMKDIYGKVIGPCGAERIAAIFAKHSMKRSFETEYGPESKVVITELCQMAAKQRAAYDEFEAEAILELESSMLEAPGGGVFAMRCAQIMSCPETFGLCKGEVTGKDQQLAIHLADHKLDGKPGVVFARFKLEQERIVEMIEAEGMTVALLNGDTSTAKRAKIDEDFRAGKLQWLVGSPQVATVGYNWDHVDHCIFASVDYNDDTFYQAYRRFIRGARKTPLLITVLEYENSIDQRIMAIIRRKSALAKSVDDTREVYNLSVN